MASRRHIRQQISLLSKKAKNLQLRPPYHPK